VGDAGDDEEFVRVITSYEDKGVEYLVRLFVVFSLTESDVVEYEAGYTDTPLHSFASFAFSVSRSISFGVRDR